MNKDKIIETVTNHERHGGNLIVELNSKPHTKSDY